MRAVEAHNVKLRTAERRLEALAGQVTPDLAVIAYQLAKAVGVWG